MKPSTSLFLDFVRIAAALVVFSFHSADFWNSNMPADPFGHGAVVIFFVLSGYVVAYSTLNKNRGVRHYIIARLSRLYSVLIPALALTALLFCIGSAIAPSFYHDFSRGSEPLRYVLCSVFLQNIWFFSACPVSNNPLWSLSYEFWYYAIFGAAVFIPSPRLKVFTLLIFALVCGPNILLLLPCWLFGVAAYRYRNILDLNPWTARLSFLVLLLALSFVIVRMPMLPLDHIPVGRVSSPLFYAGGFLKDWVSSLLVAAAVLVFDSVKAPASPHWLSSGIRFCADRTFSLYLYHYPLVVFAAGVFKMSALGLWEKEAAAVGILAFILILSYFTESKRNAWRIALEYCWDWIASFAPARPAPVLEP